MNAGTATSKAAKGMNCKRKLALDTRGSAGLLGLAKALILLSFLASKIDVKKSDYLLTS